MQPWQAQLDLRFESRAGATVLAHNQHTGPLRVQKALYPESSNSKAICHAVVVHPPAGVAAGDQLNINIAVDASAHAVITTPGATQWYKSQPHSPARLTTQLTVAAGGKLDFLPQENILFDRSHAQLHTVIKLDHGASAIGWDVCVLGRLAAGETWDDASLQQRFELHLGGERLWLEHSGVNSHSNASSNNAPGLTNTGLRHNLLALTGHSVMGTLWVVGAAGSQLVRGESVIGLSTEAVQTFAEHLPYIDSLKAGATYLQPPQAQAATAGVMVLRVLGDSAEAVRACMVDAWLHWRPIVHGVPAVPLRIWST